MSTLPLGFLPALQNGCAAAPISTQPESKIGVEGVRMPSLSPASAVIGLNVEPVGYCAAIARLNAGAPACSPKIWAKRFLVIGLTRTFGSKLGAEPSVRIRPLRGSIATNAPASAGCPLAL